MFAGGLCRESPAAIFDAILHLSIRRYKNVVVLREELADSPKEHFPPQAQPPPFTVIGAPLDTGNCEFLQTYNV